LTDCLRHQFKEDFCVKCGITYGEYLKQRRAKGYSDPIFPRLRRVNRDIELVTDLVLRNDVHDAPAKTERQGKWYECVIPIDKDHVAYLTIPEDSFRAMQEIWLEAMA